MFAIDKELFKKMGIKNNQIKAWFFKKSCTLVNTIKEPMTYYSFYTTFYIS